MKTMLQEPLEAEEGRELPRHGIDPGGISWPLRINVDYRVIEEFEHCEFGSWEDNRTPGTNPPTATDANIDSPHTCDILRRARSRIVLNNANEACAVYIAACSGTLGLHRLHGATKICDALRKFVPAEWLKLWPRPDGF